MTSSSATRAKTLGFRSLLVLGGAALAVTAAALPSRAATTTTPGFTGDQSRLLDTRTSATVDGPITGLVTIPVTDDVPTGATVELTITTVSPTGTGYVAAYPDSASSGGAVPNTSVLNYTAGRTVSNTVVVPVADGVVDVYVSGASTQLIVDQQGYFDSGALTGLAPVRIADSRSSGFAKKGPQLGTSTVTIPSDDFVAGEAVALNITALPTGAEATGYVTAYGGTTVPTTSSLNFTGTTRASNLVFVTPSSTGAVNLKVTGQANILVDIEAAGPKGSSFTATQARLADSRTPKGLPKGPLSGTYTLTIPTADAPAGTTGVVLNLTAVGEAGNGFVTAYQGTAAPTTSELQFGKGLTVAQTVVVPVTTGTAATTIKLQVRGSTQLVVDTEGYVTSETSS